MIQWYLMVGEMQSFVGLKWLIFFWVYGLLQQFPLWLILLSLNHYIHASLSRFCASICLPFQVFISDTSPDSPLLPPPWSAHVLSAVVPVFWHLSPHILCTFPLHQVHCQQFCSLFFASLSSFLWPFITMENGSCTFLFSPQRQTPHERNKMVCVRTFPQPLLLTMNCS